MMVCKARRWNKIMKRVSEDTKKDIFLEIRERRLRKGSHWVGEKSGWGFPEDK